MADHELRLVSKAIKEGNLQPALDRNVAEGWFVNPEARAMWSMVVDHWSKWGRVPSPVTVRNELPGCTILDVEESYEYLVDMFVRWRRRGLVIRLIQEASEAIDREDVERALDTLTGGVLTIDGETALLTDVDLTKTVDERLERYSQPRINGRLGIETGFPTIDKATQGLRPQQLVVLIAEPKCGKSTLALRIARTTWEKGETPMFVSFEMSNEEQQDRHDAMAAQVPHRSIVSGDLSVRDLSMLRRFLSEMKGKHPFTLIADPVATATVPSIAAKIEKYRPSVVFIDGVYLMRDHYGEDPGTPRALTNITRDLKRLAQRAKVPILITTQVLTWKLGRGRKVSGDSIGYSSSFLQDADVILGLSHSVNDDNVSDDFERQLTVEMSRACGRTKTFITFDWDRARFAEVDED